MNLVVRPQTQSRTLDKDAVPGIAGAGGPEAREFGGGPVREGLEIRVVAVDAMGIMTIGFSISMM